MAQTTTALPQGAALVSFSTNGSTWTDVSGFVAAVSHSGGDQMIGSQHTQGGDAAVVVSSGKIEPFETTINGVWTVTSSEAWDILWTAWDTSGAKTIYFKYSPQGGATSDLEFIAADDAGSAFAAPIKSLRVPDTEASGEVLMFECVLTVPNYVDATIGA